MDNHNKIIIQVANNVFSPMGFFQKGKSRTWLYDCGYCFVQVEFQPSAYSRGSFCNVGIAFLFEYFGGSPPFGVKDGGTGCPQGL